MVSNDMRKRARYISQLSLPLSYKREDDRHLHLGGKSFYFFDFDDNVAYLTTPIFLFHKDTGEEIQITSRQFARHHKLISQRGIYKDYYIDFNDDVGSFRNFRDQKFSAIEKIQKKKQSFVTDIEYIIEENAENWKAPSWNRFLHATYNQRPMSLITARGHAPETIKSGVNTLVNHGQLPYNPNYLSIYPVSHPLTKNKLKEKHGHKVTDAPSIADLKRYAIRESFLKALKKYGDDKPHRFGMSDDDPKNIDIIISEMQSLKAQNPLMSFFVIRTFKSLYIKEEILATTVRTVVTKSESSAAQLNLF